MCFILLQTEANGQDVGFRFTEKGNQIEIPIEIANNLVVVPVKVNGLIDLKFIVDTGVPTAILTEKFITDVLDVKFSRSIPLVGAAGGIAINALLTNDVRIDMKGVEGVGQALLVLEEDFLELSNYLGIEVHGIIGYELFRNFTVQIDYRHRVMRLYKTRTFRPKRNEKVFDLEIDGMKPYMKMQIDQPDSSYTAKLLIDTGAGHPLLLDPRIDPRVSLPDERIETQLGRSLTGILEGELGRVPAIRWGDFAFEDVLSSFPKSSATSEENLKLFKDSGRSGSIGSEVLKRFRVTFDYKSGKIYFKKQYWRYREPFEHDMSGLYVRAAGPQLQEFVIIDIKEGSPADEAGLRYGDQIISINATHANDLDFQSIHRLFRSKDGKKIRIRYLRNGERGKAKFRLKRKI
ncbi:MAG: aspartyl protease family protein [Cyclobacteriaceae bacterium]|nr:aspartyl protease family protein [Cyclobacteriaceae bacterium]